MVKRLSIPISMNKLELYQRLYMQSNNSSFPIFLFTNNKDTKIVFTFFYKFYNCAYALFTRFSSNWKILFIGFSNTIKDMYQYFGFHFVTKSILYHMFDDQISVHREFKSYLEISFPFLNMQ